MKLSSILSMFMFWAVCSTSILGNEKEDFYTKYGQPRDAKGNPDFYLKFLETGECIGRSCDLRGFDLSQAIKTLKSKNKKIDLHGSDCSGAKLIGVDLSGADLDSGKFNKANFLYSNLNNVTARYASFKRAYMSNTNLRHATFDHADLRNAIVQGSDLEGINIFRAKIKGSGLEGVENFYQKYNQPKNAQGSPDDYLQFLDNGICSHCNLQGFDLTEVIKKFKNKKINLENSNCSGANISNVDLSGANLSGGDFSSANFKNSKLNFVYAGFAYLAHANMQKVDARYTNFEFATLDNANCYGATIDKSTNFRAASCHSVDFRNLNGRVYFELIDHELGHFKNCKEGSTFFHKMRTSIAGILGLFSKK